MKPFREYISEGVSDLARLAGSSKTIPFWFNPKNNKLMIVGISAPGGPWHATAVAKDPRKFGTTKEEILKYMEKWDREWHFYDDFGQTVESFYDEVANQVKDRSTGIQVLMGEKGFFKCTLMRNLVSGSLGDPTRSGSVRPTKAQWRDFVGMISLIPKITEINLNGFSAPGQYVPVFKADFEFFTKYGRVPQRTEVGSRMAQFREETDVLSEGSYPIGLLRADHKGWIHPEKKMFVLFAGSDAGRPYHEEHIVIKPEEYGLTKEFIEDFFGKDERMKSKLVGFRKGTLDTNKELAKEMFDRGWVRFSKYARNGTISMENRSSNDFNILHKGSLLISPTVRWPEHEGSVPAINRIELYGKMSSIFIKSSESWEYWLKTKKEPRREETEMVGFNQWLEERFNRKIRVFDFDDTLVKTDAYVIVTDREGNERQLTPGEYAVYEKKPGEVFDYSQFQKVINPRPLRAIEKILREVLRSGSEAEILTARGNYETIKAYLKMRGIEGIFVHALGSSDPKLKGAHLQALINSGYDFIEFFDDSPKNIEAAKEVAEKNKGRAKIRLRHVK